MANEQQPLLIWRKKTFCFNFMASKVEEEEVCKVNNTPWVTSRELIETGPAMTIHQNNVISIKKTITPEDLPQRRLVIPSFSTFEYIFPHWELDKAKSLVNGYVVRVSVWDITEMNDFKKYEDKTVSFRKLPNDDYSLTIVGLFNDSGLSVGDEIELNWDPRFSWFIFKLISRIRPVELTHL